MKIEKAYFTLAEVCERWRRPEADLAYLAENEDLRLSVRVFGLAVEIASLEEAPEGRWFSVPHTETCFSGLLDLHAASAFQIFREGRAELTHFLAADGDCVSVLDGFEPLEVRRSDLLVRREERDRVEARTGFAEAPAAPAVTFEVSDDYRKIWLDGELLRFGSIQAEVIRVLHAASLSNDPWQSGKAILTAAGSKSLRMADVFKANTGWRRVIQSNQRGFYRLAVGLAAA